MDKVNKDYRSELACVILSTSGGNLVEMLAQTIRRRPKLATGCLNLEAQWRNKRP